jgi:murein DD-endopeptidase MepM/ murein hydrolase activator NlpD
MQPARLKADRLAKAQAGVRRPVARKGGGVGLWIALAVAVLGLAWGGGATYFWLQEKRTVASLQEQKAILIEEQKAQLRALTRRLVTVASSGGGQVDGLEDQLIELITKQEQLESRQAILTAIAEQLGAAVPPAAAPPTAPAGRNLTPDPNRRSEKPFRERFAAVQQAAQALDATQIRALSGFQRGVQGQGQLVLQTFADLSLDLEKMAPRTLKPNVGGPLISLPPKLNPGPFELVALSLQQGLQRLNQYKTVVLDMPLRAPLQRLDENVTSNFGPRSDPFTGATAMHSGMDFRGETGTPVMATGAGKVIRAGDGGGYGNLVIVDHGHGVTTRYAHLSAIHVSEGQTIAGGTVVGLLGSTGRSTGPHLHYETRRNDEAHDPLKFLTAGRRLFGRPQ